jgi:hypothetical protein
MKRATIILCGSACILFYGIAQAGNADVEIHFNPKQVDADGKTVRGHVNKEKENWAYDVTIENKTFKDLVGVEVKYFVFFRKEKLGEKAAPALQRQAGNTTFDTLKPHEKKVISTSPVQLTKSQLASEWYFENGGRRKAEDVLVGMWVRVYQNGQLFSEYANPSTLLKEKWE